MYTTTSRSSSNYNNNNNRHAKAYDRLMKRQEQRNHRIVPVIPVVSIRVDGTMVTSTMVVVGMMAAVVVVVEGMI